jgi:hypothetical protein
MGKHLGVAYNLRLPQELKDKIAESAKELNRSMNADIVARLEESFSIQEANKQGKFAATQESQTILTNSLNNVLSKLISNLLEEGVDPEALAKASKAMSKKSEEN